MRNQNKHSEKKKNDLLRSCIVMNSTTISKNRFNNMKSIEMCQVVSFKWNLLVIDFQPKPKYLAHKDFGIPILFEKSHQIFYFIYSNEFSKNLLTLSWHLEFLYDCCPIVHKNNNISKSILTNKTLRNMISK